MVEAPGTAPGSEWFIPTAIYRHSRQAGTANIGGNGRRRKSERTVLCKESGVADQAAVWPALRRNACRFRRWSRRWDILSRRRWRQHGRPTMAGVWCVAVEMDGDAGACGPNQWSRIKSRNARSGRQKPRPDSTRRSLADWNLADRRTARTKAGERCAQRGSRQRFSAQRPRVPQRVTP